VLVHDALLALLDAAPVQGYAGDVLQAELGPVFHVFIDFGIEKQRLGGDAAYVQAGAAEVRVFLDQGRLKAKLARTDRRRVSGRAATDDGYIVDSVSHNDAPFYRLL